MLPWCEQEREKASLLVYIGLHWYVFLLDRSTVLDVAQTLLVKINQLSHMSYNNSCDHNSTVSDVVRLSSHLIIPKSPML